MTAYQQRKVIRANLQAARCRDKDHSPERYQADDEELGRQMGQGTASPATGGAIASPAASDLPAWLVTV